MEQGNQTTHEINSETENKVEEIRLATPQSEIIKVGENPDEYTIKISLPHMCSITGILVYPTLTSNDSSLYINMFNLPEEFQQKGIGQRLLQCIVAYAKTYGATVLSGNVTSRAALKTRARVFGQDKLTFYSRTGLGKKGDQIIRNFDEILSKLPNSITSEDEEVGFSCFVDVDLKSIDTQSWELPNPNDPEDTI